ncbi:hypothetical protein KW805_02105 [Candidatus Pacearchaeota archaeon]|nr:hypothetical protein [Candidatus Pacearchaeota archaeon]
MNIDVVKSEKNELEVKLSNLTLAEVLRVYLNQQGIEFAAWRREHPTKPVILRVESSQGTVKKAVSDAIGALQKDLAKVSAALKK